MDVSSKSSKIDRNISEALKTISEIEEQLSCNSCLRFIERPVILWNCEHIFCQFCIGGRDACPICQAPSWAEDKLELCAFNDIAFLSSELKRLLHECRKKSHFKDSSKEPGCHEIASDGVPSNSGSAVKNKDNDNESPLLENCPLDETDFENEHAVERLKEKLTSRDKIISDNSMTPIEELQVDNIVDHVIMDILNEDDREIIQDVVNEKGESGAALTSRKKGNEEVILNQSTEVENGTLISESEIETQLENNSFRDKAQDEIRHSQELLAKVAAEVLDASLKEIKVLQEPCVNDSSDMDAFEVEAHELLPLNQKAQSHGYETSASLGLEKPMNSRLAKKRKFNAKMSHKNTDSSNDESSLLSKSMLIVKGNKSIVARKTQKNANAISRRKKKKPAKTFKFKVMPSGTFPDISEDCEESQSEPTSPLFLPQRFLRVATVSLNKQNIAATTSPLMRSKMAVSILPVTPINRTTLKAVAASNRSPGVRTPKSAKKNQKGETPLHIEAIKGDVNAVQSLLAENVPLNIKDNAGWTPLHEACHHGHVDVVEQLLSAGALINIPGYDNETPLMDAARQGHVDTVKTLLSRGADINLRSAYGLTALDLTTNTLVKEAIEEHLILTQAASSSLTSQNFTNTVPENIILSHSSSLKASELKQGVEVLNAIVNPKDLSVVTHHITPFYEDRRSPRTFKYLQCVARGIWIVSKDWLDSCVSSGFWVREQNYELLGSVEDLIEGGPRRSRINRAAQYPSIFHGCHFYMHGSFKSPGMSKQQASELIKLAGGTMLSREPKPDSDSVQSCTKVPYHARQDSPQYFYTYYVVYDSKVGEPRRCVRRGKVCPIPLTWILDCISQFYICEIPD